MPESVWWVDAYCSKHSGYHLQCGEDGTEIVISDYDDANRVAIALNDAKAGLSFRSEDFEDA